MRLHMRRSLFESIHAVGLPVDDIPYGDVDDDVLLLSLMLLLMKLLFWLCWE